MTGRQRIGSSWRIGWPVVCASGASDRARIGTSAPVRTVVSRSGRRVYKSDFFGSFSRRAFNAAPRATRRRCSVRNIVAKRTPARVGSIWRRSDRTVCRVKGRGFPEHPPTAARRAYRPRCGPGLAIRPCTAGHAPRCGQRRGGGVGLGVRGRSDGTGALRRSRNQNRPYSTNPRNYPRVCPKTRPDC